MGQYVINVNINFHFPSCSCPDSHSETNMLGSCQLGVFSMDVACLVDAESDLFASICFLDVQNVACIFIILYIFLP